MTTIDMFEVFLFSWAGFWVGMIVGYALALWTTSRDE